MYSVDGDTDDSDDKIVVETLELETPRRRADEPVRAKGTRQQEPLVRPADNEDIADNGPALVPRGTRDMDERARARERALSHTREPTRIPTVRDPIEVLKLWPVSSEPRADTSTARQRATLPAPSPGPHLDDKIKLAHLALDLFRELEAGTHAERGEPALQLRLAGDCEDPRCRARANALRGALVEACLLVQRIALMASPRERDEMDDRLRDLLALIDH